MLASRRSGDNCMATAYRQAMMALPLMQEWIAAAKAEPDELEGLDVEF